MSTRSVLRLLVVFAFAISVVVTVPPTDAQAQGQNIAGLAGVGSCQYTTIQGAINAAAPGQTVLVEPGTYQENLDISTNINLGQSNTPGQCNYNPAGGFPNSANLVIESVLGADDAVIEIGPSNPLGGPTVMIGWLTVEDSVSDEGNISIGGKSTVTLTAVTSQNGTNDSTDPLLGGGGISVTGESILNVLADNDGQPSKVRGNTSDESGGGIHISGGSTLLVSSSRVVLNESDGGGGGIYAVGSSVTVTDSDVSGNTAGQPGQVSTLGGGIAAYGTPLTVDATSVLDDNWTSTVGGAIYFSGADSALLVEGGAKITNNYAELWGGGIGISAFGSAQLGSPGQTQLEVVGNQSDGRGGGIDLADFWTSGIVNVNNVLIEDNTSAGRGGGIFVSAGVMVVNESGCVANTSLGLDEYCNEFIGNSAANGGGGAFASSTGTLSIVRARFDANTSTTGPTAAGARLNGALGISASLVTNHGSNSGSSIVEYEGNAIGVLKAVTFADNTASVAVDNNSSVSADVDRVLTERPFAPGSYSGACNFAKTGAGANIPGVTLGPVSFVPTARSVYELDPQSDAVDLCATSLGAAFDINNRPVQDGDNNGTAEWDAGALEYEGPSVFCNGLAATIIGDAGDNVLLGTPGPDVIWGGDGDDTINGLGGDDTICGGAGIDGIFGKAGNDWIDAGPGADTVVAGDGDDTIFGGTGDDTLNGGADNDTIEGQSGDDDIFGQSGDDILRGGGGDDFIIGLDGEDELYGNADNDILNGGPDDDFVGGGNGDDILFGLTGNDEVVGGGDNDEVFGQLGDDELEGGLGDDTVIGNEGDDTITDLGGTNVLNGGPDNDTITGGPDNDTITGDGDVTQAGNDILDGGLGSDTIVGYAGDDTLIADDGVADTVNGGPGTDTCTTDGPAIDTVYNCP